VVGDVPVDSDVLFMTDFMNLKIKPVQSFRNVHKNRVSIHVFIGVSAHTYMSIYVVLCFSTKKIDLVWLLLITD
jgi:prephenate dehydrogenase